MLVVPSRSPFTLEIRNLRALRHVRWSPQGLCALVGANGSGKSTILLSLKMLRSALENNLPNAVTYVLLLGGNFNLRNRDADPSDPVELGLSCDDLSWRIQLLPRGPTAAHSELLTQSGTTVFSREATGQLTYGGDKSFGDERLCIRALIDRGISDPRLTRIARLIEGFSVFHDPDLFGLRMGGSKVGDVRQLHSRGTNAIAMLRRWFLERPNRHRYDFVLHGLSTAFPGLVDDLDFQEAGQMLAMQFYPKGSKQPNSVAYEANGVLAMMVLLCDVAAAENDGVVAIDEPENSLHPYAIRAFLEAAASEARKRNLTIILATHSPTLLDRLMPSQIYVMVPTAEVSPVRLDQLKDPEWLANFRIGELFMNDELTPLVES